MKHMYIVKIVSLFFFLLSCSCKFNNSEKHAATEAELNDGIQGKKIGAVVSKVGKVGLVRQDNLFLDRRERGCFF